MSLYLAAYDVGDDRRRRAVGRALSTRGIRIQESVFDLRAEPDDLIELRRRLGAILAHEDEFLIVPIDERGDRVRIRWRRPPEPGDAVTLL